ncbi:MAG: hypothetical protein AB1679_14965 [Actinomycetota bacterium]|jgi:hypothetical protein
MATERVDPTLFLLIFAILMGLIGWRMHADWALLCLAGFAGTGALVLQGASMEHRVTAKGFTSWLRAMPPKAVASHLEQPLHLEAKEPCARQQLAMANDLDSGASREARRRMLQAGFLDTTANLTEEG